ncbi:hypothetical protein BS78_05G173800 [Paspalum vaginatum]|nr:hypothetical protein BS78_05G173800 [Paspalum vaginatum]
MATGSRGSSRQLYDANGDVDAFSKEELARRPEVRLINTYAVLRTYFLMALRGTGALLFLWATAVLLGGFVSSLKKKDFWYISFIAFVQAAGTLNLLLDYQLKHLITWLLSAVAWLRSAWTELQHYFLSSSRVKHNCVDKLLHQTSNLRALIVIVVLYPLVVFCLYVPVICAGLSYWRLRQPDYASGTTDASQANLKPGMDLFYYICIAQGLMFMLFMLLLETLGSGVLVLIVSQQVGLSREVVLKYFFATKLKYFDNLASSDENWNLITYGAGLLDSEMPEDNVTGARVLATLIERGMPVSRQLLRSPTHRIQKLIGALAWRSAGEAEMRWLAARIVEHVAHGLSLSQFPGALECISSLLDTSCYNKKDGNQESVNFVAQLRLDRQQDEQKGNHLEIIMRKMIIKYLMKIDRAFKNGDTEDREKVGIKSVEGTNEDLILQGLRILENVALNEQNGKVICRTDALLSKIVAPVSSEGLIQDTKTNTAWTKVTDGSLKLVSQLMRSPGDTGKEMRRRVSDNSLAVENLEEVLALELSSSDIIGIQVRAIEILQQLCSGESTTISWARERRENLSTKVLHIFLTDKWMDDYISMTAANPDEDIASQPDKSKKSKKSLQAGQVLVQNKKKAAQDTVNQLKEKAGEALATLYTGNQIDSDYIRGFKTCGGVVRYLTEMLVSEKSTIRCRYSAAVILKHLCTHCTTLGHDHQYLKETTLKKVLGVVLQPQETRTIKISHGLFGEIKRGDDHDQDLPSIQRHKQQLEQRTLQVALLSLCTSMIHGKWIKASYLASVVAQLVPPKDLAEKLKKMVEESRYTTVSCLATVKLTCEIVMVLIPHDHLDIKMKKEIVDSLCQASETMAGIESCMLFAGADRDCYGLPVKPFCSHLVKKAQELLREKEQEMGLPIV